MSDLKRATLTTKSSKKSDDKKVAEKCKTVRFSLSLPESNEKSCPEFNYRDLLNSVEKKCKTKNQDQVNGFNNHLDPFDDNDDDVKRIAQQFEAKYGGVPKKRRRGKKDDYADIGAGYDESDSFIDNTDAYDEMVPADVTTVHGGFYINSGALEFKQVSGSESSDSESSDNENSPRRKNDEEESEESESEEEKEINKIEPAKKKHKIDTNEVQQPQKKKLLSTDEIPPKKSASEEMEDKLSTIKELVREKREEFDISLIMDSPIKKDEKDKVNISSISEVIESVVNAGRVQNHNENSNNSSSSSDVIPIEPTIPLELETVQNNQSIEPKKLEPEIPIVKLPENIPENILKIVNDLKKAAENSEGKVKFFSGYVNKLLLSLEINSRKLMKPIRMQIYEHLAPFVRCKKDTLMRRAKNLMLEQEKIKLKDPLIRLTCIVESMMPTVKESYAKECQKVRDEMFFASATSANSNGDVHNKIRRIPRKKFPWTEEIRKTFQEIISIQKKCLILEGTRKEKHEEKLTEFLKERVLQIWPDGFMSLNALVKQTKHVLEKLDKQKSLILSTPKPAQAPAVTPAQPSTIKPMQSVTVKPVTIPSVNPLPSPTMKPITLDIHSPPFSVTPTSPFAASPVKTSPSCVNTSSGITVIPISSPSPKLPSTNGPKLKHSPSISIKPSEISVTINKKPDSSPGSAINMAAEICAVSTPKDSSERQSSSLLIPSSKSNITISDVRTISNSVIKDPPKQEDVNKQSSKLINLKPKLLNEKKPDEDDCQIIDLTETPIVIRKPGPKSKTKYVDAALKPKRVKQVSESGIRSDKKDDPPGNQSFDSLTPNLNYGMNLTDTKSTYKDPVSSAVIEDDMEQVMKDLKELQQLQEHARKTDLDLSGPSSSPVSVIAFNSSYSSSNKHQSNDFLKERNSANFQDLFHKQFLHDSMMKTNPSSAIYNSNLQPKTNYNSINNFAYSSTGSISNTINSIRYSQSSNKYATSMNHLPTNQTGATNHADDLALFQNLFYQYGFHNSSGSKQKSPP